ncbi:MAG: circadian clock KaiB family protein [Solirubrobacteraceae bacterium]
MPALGEWWVQPAWFRLAGLALPVSSDQHDSEGVVVVLRLYVAGGTPPSTQARRQLTALRERLGGEDWRVEVVDVFERPELAETDRILATPVLLRLAPSPRLSVIGDLGNWRAVARILDLGGGFEE